MNSAGLYVFAAGLVVVTIGACWFYDPSLFSLEKSAEDAVGQVTVSTQFKDAGSTSDEQNHQSTITETAAYVDYSMEDDPVPVSRPAMTKKQMEMLWQERVPQNEQVSRNQDKFKLEKRLAAVTNHELEPDVDPAGNKVDEGNEKNESSNQALQE